jgi:hypothetical protein
MRMNTRPTLHNRTRILDFCKDSTKDLEHAVLLLPVNSPDAPLDERAQPNFSHKDRVGRIMTHNLVALSPNQAFDAAVSHSIFLTNAIPGVGTHLTQSSRGYETDVMATNPNQLKGEGNMLIVDGYGWEAMEHDPVLSNEGARFFNTLPEVRVLGRAVINLADLAIKPRAVSDPAMEHYQVPRPIGM